MTGKDARVLVWDGAVRLFHWLAVLLVALMWWTAENGVMDWHRRLGIILLSLLVFRFIWGLIGPPTARFARMTFHPRAVFAYFRDLLSGRHRPAFGHNPAGTLSVFAILLVLCVQVGTGLFAVDVDGLESGPLARHVSFEAGRQAAEIHETSFNILIALILLHVAAIVTYLIAFRDNLVRPMVTGRRRKADFAEDNLADNRAPWGRVGLALVLTIACVAGLLTVWG